MQIRPSFGRTICQCEHQQCNFKKKAKHLAKHMWERIANGRNTCDLKKSSKSLAVEQMLRHSQVGIRNGIES